MYARVSTYELEQAPGVDATQSFSSAIERIRGLDGLVEAFFLLELDGRRAITMTLWESVDAMERSRVAASRARTDAAHEADATVISTCEFEVGAHAGAAVLGL